jgi:hypothetical protein
MSRPITIKIVFDHSFSDISELHSDELLKNPEREAQPASTSIPIETPVEVFKVAPDQETSPPTAPDLEPTSDPPVNAALTILTDEIAPELRLSPSEVANSIVWFPIHLCSEADHRQVSSVKFTPYESPLKMFKAYRNHSNFTEDVAGGIQSMTYSNKIDPHQPVCQVEMSGGTCDDPQCPGQHFKSMSLPGECDSFPTLLFLGTSTTLAALLEY